jgi:hypothetical protein
MENKCLTEDMTQIGRHMATGGVAPPLGFAAILASWSKAAFCSAGPASNPPPITINPQ